MLSLRAGDIGAQNQENLITCGNGEQLHSPNGRGCSAFCILSVVLPGFNYRVRYI